MEDIDEFTISTEDLENEIMGFLVTMDNDKEINVPDWNIVQLKISQFVNEFYKNRKI